MSSLSRRDFLSAGAALTSAALWSAPARAAEFNYKFGLELREDQPLPKRMTEACKLILEESKGRLDIRPFPNQQLGGSQEMLTQLRNGSIEFLTSSYGLMSGVVPAAGMPTLGFLFDSYEKAWAAVEGDLGNYIAREIQKKGEMLIIATGNDLGFRQVTASKRMIMDPKDMKGFKIRTPQSPYLVSLFAALGASPTPLPFPDLYSALQTGLVDGQDNPLDLVASFKFYEVQKYCTITNHSWDAWVPVANRRAWERLPEDLRNTVSRNFNKAAELQRKDSDLQHAAVQTELVKKGMQFHTPAPGLFRDALRRTDFYPQWKAKLGDEAWAALERSVGKLV